jgi:hypothetical protein
MEPQIQPHPAAAKVIDFSDWACNTTECTEISLGENHLRTFFFLAIHV